MYEYEDGRGVKIGLFRIKYESDYSTGLLKEMQ